MNDFQQYQRTQIAELRPYVKGESLVGISISEVDIGCGSPRVGDMIARNPANHADQWLVAKAYFEQNFAPLEDSATIEALRRRVAELEEKVTYTETALRLRDTDVDRATKALKGFREYDGDYDLWGSLVEQRDKAVAENAELKRQVEALREASTAWASSWLEIALEHDAETLALVLEVNPELRERFSRVVLLKAAKGEAE